MRSSLWLRVPLRLGRYLAALIVIGLIGGLCTAMLVRFSPGFGVDERELDARLSQERIRQIRESRSGEASLPQFYLRYLNRLLHGDLGLSHEFQRPVTMLIRERTGVSAHSFFYAIPLAWIVAFLMAAGATASCNRGVTVIVSLMPGALLTVPVAIIALFAANSGQGARLALVVVLAPTLFRYICNVLNRAFRQPHILAAKSRGVGSARVLFCHVLPNAAPQLIALAGISVSMAFGALIPVEALCDSPGVGQLALQAALARDLPLLIGLSLMICLATLTANMVADVINESLVPRSA
jgi:peptide/nickel transport system permease protein